MYIFTDSLFYSDVPSNFTSYPQRSRINELEEEQLIESGRSRIAGKIHIFTTSNFPWIFFSYKINQIQGSRTKMELAWQKEREGQKKLISELNTMAKDLKATLMEVEREKERNRLETTRKMEAARYRNTTC